MFLNYITKKIGNAMSIVLLVCAALIVAAVAILALVAHGVVVTACALQSE
jgi:hypothetical protein